MHMGRLHVVIEPMEREAFRAAARRSGLSLSEWLREAAREKLAVDTRRSLRTAEDLQTFFDELDARRRDETPEKDWSAVKQRIAASRSSTTGT